MRLALSFVLLLSAYLLAWPVSITPLAWTPPPAPSLETGFYAVNDKLRGVERLLAGAVSGPEAVAVNDTGQMISGLADGRIITADGDGSGCRVLAQTGGRPLGLAPLGDGRLVVADAMRGLLEVSADGAIKVLATEAEGIRIGFADDLDVDQAGRVYFSDASWKFGYGKHLDDLLEHGAHGRLLRYDPADGAAFVLLANLHFANGVALGPDDGFVLVSQSTEYRITRFWLKGERAGQSENFADNLPGIPDNISFNGTDRFWVALFAPRSAALDALLPHPFLRKIVARLPAALQVQPKHRAFLLGLDLDGKVVEQYQFADGAAFAPITHVEESGGYLYLGSLSQSAVGRIALSELRGSGASGEPPPPVPGPCAPQPAQPPAVVLRS